MEYNLSHIKTSKNNIPVHVFTPESQPVGVVQLIYGVKSHATKYEDTIKYLTNNGFIVVCADLIEHGKNLYKVPYSKNIFNETASEQLLTSISIKQQTNLPYVVLAHSYGGYLTLDLMKNAHFDADGIVLTGIGDVRRPSTLIAKTALKVVNRVYKKNYKQSDVVNANENYVYSDNPRPVEKKIAGLPIKLAANLSEALASNQLYNVEDMKIIVEKTPILLLSGEQDPKTKGGKDTLKLYAEMKKGGLKVDANIIKNAEHAVLRQIDEKTGLPHAVPFIQNFLNDVCELKTSIQQGTTFVK